MVLPCSLFNEQPDYMVQKYTLKSPMPQMHYHSVYELYYVLSGERDYFIGDRFFSAKEGDFVLIPKEELHRTAGKVASRILLYFSDTFLERYFSKDMISFLLSDYTAKILTPQPEKSNYFLNSLTEILRVYESEENPADQRKSAALLFELLYQLKDLGNFQSAKKEKGSKCNAILKYVNENFATIKTVEEVAAHFFISPSYLSRLFNNELGVSLFTYINTVRIREACILIREGKLNITEIAFRCGFNTSSYFCKVFGNRMKMSPREYQKHFASHHEK